MRVPQAGDNIDYPYTKVQDFQENDSGTAIFGPGASNKTVYRLKVVALSSKKDFSKASALALSQVLNKMQAFYGIKPIILLQEPIAPHGRAGIFGVYQQNLTTDNEVLTQSAYIIQSGRYLVECWITASSLSERDKVGDMNRIDVVKRLWQPADRFLDSFQILN